MNTKTEQLAEKYAPYLVASLSPDCDGPEDTDPVKWCKENFPSLCAEAKRCLLSFARELAQPEDGEPSDTEMLDWVSEMDAMPEWDDNGFWKIRFGGRWYSGNTVRSAIRAALQSALTKPVTDKGGGE